MNDEAIRRLFNYLFDLGGPGCGDDVQVFHHFVLKERLGLIEIEPDRYAADIFKSGPYGGIFQRSFNAAFNRSRMFFGTPAGAPKPNEPSNLYCSKPACAVVGVFGSTGRRASPATARAIAPLAVSGPNTFGYHAKPSCTVPAIKSGPLMSIGLFQSQLDGDGSAENV